MLGLEKKKYYRLYLKPNTRLLAVTFHDKKIEGAYKLTRVSGTGYVEAKSILAQGGFRYVEKGPVSLAWDERDDALIVELGQNVKDSRALNRLLSTGEGTQALRVRAQIAEVVTDERQSGTRWQPVVGEEASALSDNLALPTDGKAMALQEAVDVLARCAPPFGDVATETGLGVGRVQSGKTTSFTMVTALARDNRFKMVIVIAGTKVNLYNQSKERLYRDLRIHSRRDRTWVCFDNPKREQAELIAGVLAAWDDPVVHESQKKTVLITIMKQHQRLASLIEMVEVLRTYTNFRLESVPTLIIDDEADSASLNNLVNECEMSTTYRRLLTLKAVLPRHSFLQYTATPQAPLLINIIDLLSPSFVKVLTPGEGYVGGEDFFLAEPTLIRPIPELEIPGRDNTLVEAPPSLVEAMRLFVVGVAAGYVLREDSKGKNRAMMVHPSMNTGSHQFYFNWVSQIKDQWAVFLSNPSSEHAAELMEEFRHAHEELTSTVDDLPAFEDIQLRLPQSVRETHVFLVNSTVRGGTPLINWRNNYANILVGGQAMDRGYTVEGLTVTYMPRSLGTGMADTVQQRGRFFGYKREYLGYCRVYVPELVRSAYVQYVRHEADMHERLTEHERSGLPLSRWKRAFFLDRMLKPTRDNVIDIDYRHVCFSDSWFYPRRPLYAEAVLADNREAVRALLSTLSCEPDEGHPKRSKGQKHVVDHGVPLQKVYECLVQYKVTHPEEAQHYYGLLLQLKRYLDEHEGEEPSASVYVMSPEAERSREVDEEGYFENLFQGSDPSKPKKGEEIKYPGDRSIKVPDRLTLQVHRIRLDYKGGKNIANTPVLAVWVPSIMAGSVIVQGQP